MTFTITDIFLLGFGIFIGIIWGALIFVKRKRKVVLKHINVGYENISNDEKAEVNNLINSIYNYHNEARKTNVRLFFGIIDIKKQIDYNNLALSRLGKKDSDKMLPLTEEMLWLINEVASIYYPESKHPLFELTIDELFLLVREILSLVSNIIFEIGIPNLEQLKMSTVKDLILLGGKVRKVYNLRGVRLTIGFVNAAIKLQSVVTPIYWVKKGTNIVSVNSLSQFLVKCMFEVVGKVTANIYSKNFTNN
ncbi:MAG: hypothetical protein IKT40_13950 [Bacilli bacterium]|nr:hypothetical protein [Bacilli bacterium]